VEECLCFGWIDGLVKKSFVMSQKHPLPLIIDADTGNEVDDLYAIARALIEPALDIRGITAAQWHTQERAPNNCVGESQRLNEDILRLMDKTEILHHQGSNFPMVNTHRPQPSAAADLIIELAMAMPEGEKLSVAVLGPCTNPASAILMEPAIIPKLAVYYIGFWHDPASNTWSKREFNTNNDPNAVDTLINEPRLEFHVMTASTSQHLVFEKTEVDRHLKGTGGIGAYLVERWETYDRFWQKTDPEKKRWIMWDVAIIEALADPSLATQSTFTTPHDNRARAIYAYTDIDVPKMKTRYWEAFAKAGLGRR